MRKGYDTAINTPINKVKEEKRRHILVIGSYFVFENHHLKLRDLIGVCFLFLFLFFFAVILGER